MIDLLTREELKSLSGAKRSKSICLWLIDKEWVFEEGADGWPRVDRRYYDKRMSGEAANEESEPFLEAVI